MTATPTTLRPEILKLPCQLSVVSRSKCGQSPESSLTHCLCSRKLRSGY